MNNHQWVAILLVSVVLAGCSMLGGDKEPQYSFSDLQGYWLQTNDATEHYVRFTEEKADETGYYLGYEWHDADWDDPEMTFEEYLIWNREQLGHPGNGWFKYQFVVTDGGLHEIHFMDNEGAEIPKFDYVVSKLTDTELEYYEKDYQNFKYKFSRVVKTK